MPAYIFDSNYKFPEKEQADADLAEYDNEARFSGDQDAADQAENLAIDRESNVDLATGMDYEDDGSRPDPSAELADEPPPPTGPDMVWDTESNQNVEKDWPADTEPEFDPGGE
jgi:hypothetical protein